jgi:hypothetical protein
MSGCELELRESETEFVLFSEQSETKEEPMSETLINLIIQLVAGALGGNGAGNALKDLNLGPLGNTIAGAIGGVAGG